MLVNCFAERKATSMLGCAAQFYFRGVCMVIECSLLAAMACECYMAICNPLLYVVTMSSITCATFPHSDTISVLIFTSCASILAVILKYTLCWAAAQSLLYLCCLPHCLTLYYGSFFIYAWPSSAYMFWGGTRWSLCFTPWWCLCWTPSYTPWRARMRRMHWRDWWRDKQLLNRRKVRVTRPQRCVEQEGSVPIFSCLCFIFAFTVGARWCNKGA